MLSSAVLLKQYKLAFIFGFDNISMDWLSKTEKASLIKPKSSAV